MEKSRNIKALAITTLVISIFGMGLAFAALSTSLNITGSATISGPSWNIRFENLGSAVTTGDVLEGTPTPTLTDATLTDVNAIFNGDGTLSYEFDVKNDGILNAKIGTLTIFNTPVCTGMGSDKTADETLVCSSISTQLTYVTGGSAVTTGDLLAAGETKRMKLTISYNASAETPSNQVDVSGLGATIVYEEE